MKFLSLFLFVTVLGGSHTSAYATPATISTSSSWLQVIGSLLLVIGVVLLCAWCVRRFGLGHQASPNALLSLVSSLMVGQREKIVIVEADGMWLVLGVTPQSINLLYTMSVRETLPIVPNSASFSASLAQKLRDSFSGSEKKNHT